MLTKQEKELMIQIISNIDDIIKELSFCQKRAIDKSIKRIYLNYHNLIEGIPEDAEKILKGDIKMSDHKLNVYDVYLAGRIVDTVYWAPLSNGNPTSSQDVKKSLIERDGHNPNIKVYRRISR